MATRMTGHLEAGMSSSAFARAFLVATRRPSAVCCWYEQIRRRCHWPILALSLLLIAVATLRVLSLYLVAIRRRMALVALRR